MQIVARKYWVLGLTAAAAATVTLALAFRPAARPKPRVMGESWRLPSRAQALEALIRGLDTAARESPVEVTLHLRDGPERVRVHRANARTVTVSVEGLPRPVPWEDLEEVDIAAAAWAAAREDAGRLLVAADFCLAAGLTREAEEILDLAARGPGAAAFAPAVGARRTALAQAAPPAPQEAPTDKDDWYCPAYDAAHTYTSKDALPAPLKFKWHWKAPQGKVYQVLASGGKVFVKGMHPNDTPIGVRTGVHNFVLDPETGAQLGEDPEGTSPNDFTFGWPGGTYGGKIYQADDGGPPFCGADVWGPVQIDPVQKMWLTVQHMRVDGPSPGVYVMPVGQGVWGKKWWVGLTVNVKDMQTYCEGDGAIGPGVAYVIIQWKVREAAAKLKSGLLCYDLATGAERWHVAGEFESISAGEDFCVAATKAGALAAYGAADGKLQWTAQAGGRLECHPMVAGNVVRVYDASGNLTTLKIAEAGGRRSVSAAGSQMLGKYAGPRTVGRQNSCFCFSADGTMYVANGNAVGGMKPGKKSWQWPVPPALLQIVGPLGGPILARGKLYAVGSTGVVCWDTAGAPKKE